MEVSKSDLNGLGTKLNQVQLEVAEMKGKVERNTGDVQILFQTSTDIKKTVENNKWQVLAMVAIPVIILVFQLLSKGAK